MSAALDQDSADLNLTLSMLKLLNFLCLYRTIYRFLKRLSEEYPGQKTFQTKIMLNDYKRKSQETWVKSLKQSGPESGDLDVIAFERVFADKQDFSISQIQFKKTSLAHERPPDSDLNPKVAFFLEIRELLRKGQVIQALKCCFEGPLAELFRGEKCLALVEIYERVDFIETSVFYVNSLLEIHPENDFLICKQAQLYKKLHYARLRKKRHSSLIPTGEDFAEIANKALSRPGEWVYRNKVLNLKAEVLFLQNRFDEALDIWTRLRDSEYNHPKVYLNLSFFFLKIERDYDRLGECFHELLYIFKNIVLEDKQDLHKYVECLKQVLGLNDEADEFDVKGDSEFEGTFIKLSARPHETSAASVRTVKLERALRRGTELMDMSLIRLKHRRSIEGLLEQNPVVFDFAKGFINEFSCTFSLLNILQNSVVEFKFNNLTLTFGSVLVNSIPCIGHILAKSLNYAVNKRTRLVFLEKKNWMINFAFSEKQMVTRAEQILHELLLCEGVAESIVDEARRVQASPSEAVLGVWNGIFKQSKFDSDAELLGRSMAKSVFDRFIFREDSKHAANDQIVHFLLQNIALVDLQTQIPPRRVLESKDLGSFYIGFSEMTLFLLELAEKVRAGVDTRSSEFVLLRTVREIKLGSKGNFDKTAAKLLRVFRSKDEALRLIRDGFDLSLAETCAMGVSFYDFVCRVKKYKTGRTQFCQTLRETWTIENLPPAPEALHILADKSKTAWQLSGAFFALRVCSSKDLSQPCAKRLSESMLRGKFEKKSFLFFF